MKSDDELIAELKEKEQQYRNRWKKVEQRQKKRKRQEDTRRKILAVHHVDLQTHTNAPPARHYLVLSCLLSSFRIPARPTNPRTAGLEVWHLAKLVEFPFAAHDVDDVAEGPLGKFPLIPGECCSQVSVFPIGFFRLCLRGLSRPNVLSGK